MAALAAATMYWLDPTSGRRRRARLRDRLLSRAYRTSRALDVAGRDLGNRLQGIAARVRSAFDSSQPSDEVLKERVRACLGRIVSHPGAIEVKASNGSVTLSGAVLARDYARLMQAVERVRGVRRVEDRLGVYADANGIPALQGGVPRRTRSFELMQENWSPAARLLTSTAGGVLLLQGLRARGLAGLLGTAAGGMLLARSTMNMPLKRLVGASGRRAVDIRKTIRVNAPVDQVFQLMSQYETYPLFARNVRRVRLHPDGRSHWSVAGPAGIPVEWDAVTTQLEPNQILAWRTVPNATVQHAGIIRFEPQNGSTRVDIRMSYNPPGGVLGHVFATLLGADPRTRLDEDMLRLKSFLETGRQPRDAAANTLLRYTPIPPEVRLPGVQPPGERVLH